MIVNAATLRGAKTAFSTLFFAALSEAKVRWPMFAMLVKSNTKQTVHAWLGQFPQVREWIGERVLRSLSQSDYAIINKLWEQTLSVNRDDVDDDQFGIYAPLIESHGQAVKQHPDELVISLFLAGFTTNCYDGQFFFDTDHPGAPGVTWSNYTAGAGAAWYLLDCSKPIKPFIFQERRKPEFVFKFNPDDESVWTRNEYEFGMSARYNAGFGLPQLAFASKATLDTAGFDAARTAMGSLRGDEGRSLKIVPTHIVVPPSLEGAARRLMTAELINNETNIWKGACEVLCLQELAP